RGRHGLVDDTGSWPVVRATFRDRLASRPRADPRPPRPSGRTLSHSGTGRVAKPGGLSGRAPCRAPCRAGCLAGRSHRNRGLIPPHRGGLAGFTGASSQRDRQAAARRMASRLLPPSELNAILAAGAPVWTRLTTASKKSSPALPARRPKNVETLHPVETLHAYSVFYFRAMQSFQLAQSFQDLFVPGKLWGVRRRPATSDGTVRETTGEGSRQLPDLNFRGIEQQAGRNGAGSRARLWVFVRFT